MKVQILDNLVVTDLIYQISDIQRNSDEESSHFEIYFVDSKAHEVKFYTLDFVDPKKHPNLPSDFLSHRGIIYGKVTDLVHTSEFDYARERLHEAIASVRQFLIDHTPPIDQKEIPTWTGAEFKWLKHHSIS